MSPTAPQAQHRYRCRSGSTSNEGRWSSWKGHSPTNVRPRRRSATYSPTRSTIDRASLIALTALVSKRVTGVPTASSMLSRLRRLLQLSSVRLSSRSNHRNARKRRKRGQPVAILVPQTTSRLTSRTVTHPLLRNTATSRSPIAAQKTPGRPKAPAVPLVGGPVQTLTRMRTFACLDRAQYRAAARLDRLSPIA